MRRCATKCGYGPRRARRSAQEAPAAAVLPAAPWSCVYRPQKLEPRACPRWLAARKFDHPAQQIVFQDQVDVIIDAQHRLERLDAQQMAELAPSWSMAPVVAAYQALRGVSFVVAVTFVSEVGDVRRFDNPRQLMAFLGLVPSERSTGDTVKRGGLTLAGNRRARRRPGGGRLELSLSRQGERRAHSRPASRACRRSCARSPGRRRSPALRPLPADDGRGQEETHRRLRRSRARWRRSCGPSGGWSSRPEFAVEYRPANRLYGIGTGPRWGTPETHYVARLRLMPDPRQG